jgi:hypothetical protein
LNQGTGANSLYLCYKSDSNGSDPPITEITAKSDNWTQKPGEGWYPVTYLDENKIANINKGTRQEANDISVWYRRDQGKPAVTDLIVRSYDYPQQNSVPGYRMVSHDLNKGAGGKYIYIFYK